MDEMKILIFRLFITFFSYISKILKNLLFSQQVTKHNFCDDFLYFYVIAGKHVFLDASTFATDHPLEYVHRKLLCGSFTT